MKIGKLSDLKAAGYNPRRISDEALKGLGYSLKEFGDLSGIVFNIRTGNLVAGHQRVKVLQAQYGDLAIEKGYIHANGDRFAVRLVDWPKEKEQAANVAANSPTIQGEFTEDLQTLLNSIQVDLPEVFAELNFEDLGVDLNHDLKNEITKEEGYKTLAERFGVPPFSVLDARQGYWQERKQAWIALGIRGELGRGENLIKLSESNDQYRYKKDEYLARIGRGKKADARTFGSGNPGDLGKRLTWVAGNREESNLDETSRKILAAGRKTANNKNYRQVADLRSNLNNAPLKPPRAVSTGTTNMAPGTSIFDPVLCELVYRWFMPPDGGAILDPFAGGSVRGIVAAKLGKQYTGIDLSDRQIEANKLQADEILTDNLPTWIVGDSLEVQELAPGVYDFIFSCPPYFDLEVYSNDERDLSQMTYTQFLKSYRDIITASCSMLNENRFACFVVGDIRDKKGFYRNFPADTIMAFQDCGLILYNDAVLVTAVGSLPIRGGKQFGSYRKLGKTHQNVLIFYKGNPQNIKAWGEPEFGEIETEEKVTT